MNLDIKLIPPKALPPWIPGLRKYLAKSEAWTRGRAEAVDIIEFLISGQMLLWVVVDEDFCPYGYVITETKNYPRCSMLVVQYCAGENSYMKYIEDKMYDTLDKFAQDSGCAGIEFFGRRGWANHVKKHGYEAATMVYERYFK